MDLDNVETIEFKALGGADKIVVNDLSGTDVSTVNIDLGLVNGAGDGAADVVTVNATGGDDVGRGHTAIKQSVDGESAEVPGGAGDDDGHG